MSKTVVGIILLNYEPFLNSNSTFIIARVRSVCWLTYFSYGIEFFLTSSVPQHKPYIFAAGSENVKNKEIILGVRIFVWHSLHRHTRCIALYYTRHDLSWKNDKNLKKVHVSSNGMEYAFQFSYTFPFLPWIYCWKANEW